MPFFRLRRIEDGRTTAEGVVKNAFNWKPKASPRWPAGYVQTSLSYQ